MRKLLLLGIALAALIAPAHAADPSNVSGNATNVGVAPPPGEDGQARVRLEAKIAVSDAIDLPDAIVTVEELLTLDGEELVKGADAAEVLPATLLPKPSATNRRTIYESDPAERPRFRLRVRQNRGGMLRFILRAKQAAIPVHPCPDGSTVDLQTTFRIEPPAPGTAVVVSEVVEWWCKSNRLLVERRPGFPGGGGPPHPPGGGCGDDCPNKPPTASLRSELLTRNTGEPDLVELDATGSQDRDGVVVRYVFDSGDGRIQDGPGPFMQLTYPPGDHRAYLTVYDNEGIPSALVSRGFSIK